MIFFADYTKNISKGGTFIKTNKPLRIGTEFIFKLHIPSLDEPLSLLGSVQWVVTPEQATHDEPAGMGIEFVYSDTDQKDAIHNRVEKLMIENLGYHLYTKLVKQAEEE